MTPKKRQQSDYDMDERAAEAQFLLNHPLLKEVLQAMRAQYVDQVTAALDGSPDAANAQAKLRVLADFQAGLQSIVTDQKMAKKKGVRYG